MPDELTTFPGCARCLATDTDLIPDHRPGLRAWRCASQLECETRAVRAMMNLGTAVGIQAATTVDDQPSGDPIEGIKRAFLKLNGELPGHSEEET